MKNTSSNFLITLFTLAGLGILIVGIYYFKSPILTSLSYTYIRSIMLSLFFLDALGYLITAWGIYKKITWIYPFALTLLATNILAFFFDDIGLADILAALFNALLGILLIIKRGRYGSNDSRI